MKKEKKEILEGNKLIALFMGAKLIEYSAVEHEVYFEKYPDNSFYHQSTISQLKYHSSWDWLIPALNKAYSIIDETTNRSYAVSLFNILNTFLCNNYENGKKTDLYDIGRAWNHLIDFIECYNRLNKTKK